MPADSLPARSLRGAAAVAAALVLLAAAPAPARPGDGYAGVSGDAVGAPAAAVGAPAAAARVPAAATIPGIDVSHWQGRVDWSRVAGAGKRFVFLKATEDDWYVDPTYATNRAGARREGLRVGAYHFAQPSAAPGDARKEARWFVRHAEPRAGDLLPVLDIETTGGLGPDALTTWAKRFAAETRRRTGVRPLVYTSPYGWQVRFRDSTALARWGTPLWIAHWGVQAPTLPADGWAGRGWAVWQHSSTGRVPGIQGNVDLDVLQGADLGVITIRRLRVTVDGEGGRVASTPAGFGCRTDCSRHTDPGALVTLRAIPDEGGVFLGWSGACRGTEPCAIAMTKDRAATARFTLDPVPPTATIAPPDAVAEPLLVRFDERVSGVDAWSVSVRRADGTRLEAVRRCRSVRGVVPCGRDTIRSVAVRPTIPWKPGRTYRVVVSPTGARIRDRVGNPAATTSARFAISG